ncbi:alpha-glucuronidase family glycosyl hydrolase [Paenibacillus sp. GCM10027628]|uniref:alpha-glucuronidase family glycosyl hydrolase n=1 Tax=Paenibacillus sp. GCM10027628 TaxID=3273413 RepID=UPI0036361D80
MNNQETDLCWLRHTRIDDEAILKNYRIWCQEVVASAASAHSEVFQTAVDELCYGIAALLGQKTAQPTSPSKSHTIILGVWGHSPELEALIDPQHCRSLKADGFIIQTVKTYEHSYLILAGASDKGALYAVFEFLRRLQNGDAIDHLNMIDNPNNRLRMMNQWDNMDGSIERGYAGRSIFFKENAIMQDYTRIRAYARILASIGLNAIAINNVNVHRQETMLITEALLPEVATIAAIFRAYGITLFLSINYASTMEIGGLTTADPLSTEVKQWWKEKAVEIYRYIPDFGGFLVKADSEFRPGPFTYGRDHADGANMLAEALHPHGGLVIWRCFVYNCLQDWRDRSTDRAKAAYAHFTPLDGKFHDNVILQIKNGPMDFQVREPVSPLIGGLRSTNQMLELQVTQEYTGQQKHLCFLVPQWKEVLDFDTYAQGQGSTTADIVSGSLFNRTYGGIAAVSNIGDDMNWTGHVLAQANLYGFGRLAWNPCLSSEEIAKEWIAITFGTAPQVQNIILDMLLHSWSIYEKYTAPLGVGWMVNPGHHYGPNVDGYEYAKWGTYHYADCHGIGVDRTFKSGTRYTTQYHEPQSSRYESLEQCPDELLLFFHHVPYTHVLKSGKTVIQHIYDSHFEGAEQAAGLVSAWTSLKGLIDDVRYVEVLQRLQEQAEHAKEWRDIINTYFARKSGIPDKQGRMIY